jgi:hypothetical protein
MTVKPNESDDLQMTRRNAEADFNAASHTPTMVASAAHGLSRDGTQ